jgi:hypothetical protein
MILIVIYLAIVSAAVVAIKWAGSVVPGTEFIEWEWRGAMIGPMPFACS